MALAILAALERTCLSNLSSLVAIIVPSLVVSILSLEGVQRVVDVSPVPRSIPMPAVPNFALLTPDLLLAALAIAVVIAIQGAGVSQSVENPDGSPDNPSRDMVAQGVANAASGVYLAFPREAPSARRR